MCRALLCILTVCLLAGCTQEAPAPPPVPPPPEDLSVWSVPALVQPERPKPTTARPKKVPAGPAEKVADYVPGVAVEVPVALGMPLAVVLEEGEQVRQIVDGDRAPAEEGKVRRWEVREGAEGSGDSLRPHIFITASEVGLTNGVTLTTTKRSYLLTCKSVARSPVRLVRWHYPEERPPVPVEEPPSLVPRPDAPARYHVGYTVTSPRLPAPVWTPRQIADDGKKLYILYPEIALFDTVPLVRELGVNGPQLLNSRQVLNVLILDKLAGRLELRVGVGEQAEVVTVSRGELRTIECPGAAECPRWPAAAVALGRMP